MRRSLAIVILMIASSANAQFLGDSLAAAGFAEGEDELGGYALATLAARAAGWPATQPTPPPPTPAPQPVVAPPSGPIPQLQPMTGSGAGFAGGGTMVSSEVISAWKAAWQAVGTKVAAPPEGSSEVNATTRYFKGVFYEKRGNAWVVVPAVVGALVTERPAPAVNVTAGGRPYLYYNGTFSIWNAAAGAYEVVAPPVGAVVTAIPESALTTDAGGASCYRYGTTCFEPMYRGSTIVYRVAG